MLLRHDKLTHSNRDSGVLSGYVEFDSQACSVVTVYTCDLCQFQCHNHFALVDHMRVGIHDVVQSPLSSKPSEKPTPQTNNPNSNTVAKPAPSPKSVTPQKSIAPQKSPQTMRRYKCDSCDYTSEREYYMKLHVATHKRCKKAKKFYRCARCGYDAQHKYTVVRHSRKKHRNETALTIMVCNYKILNYLVL